jgi:putative membrane protein
METLADWGGHGPGPWILLMPLLWAFAVAAVVLVLRRTRHAFCRHGGHGGPGGSGGRGPGSAAEMLARRFAQGEIDEDEYWSRLSVLNETRKDAP